MLNRRLLLTQLALIIGFSGNLAVLAQPSSSLWSPASLPNACTQVEAQALLLDGSGSMKPIFSEVKQQIQNYIKSAPDCTYVILANFGTTADVKADSFLVGEAQRQQLIAKLSRMQANQQFTNFDEAAKLIELILLKLQQAYGEVPVSLSVKVLSDDVPDPSQGKTPFSLPDFMKRLKTEQVNVVAVNLKPTGQSQSLPAKPGNYTELRIVVRELEAFLGRNPPKPAATQPTPQPTPASPPVKPGQTADKPESGRSLNPFLIGSGVVGAIALVAILFKRASKNTAAATDRMTRPTIPALSITESEVVGQGNPQVLKRERVAVSPDVPVWFGTDSSQCTYVIAPMPQAEQLFSVTVTPKGNLRVEGKAGISCNGQPIPSKGMELPSEETFQVQYQQRQWAIRSAANTTQHKTAADFLAQLPTPSVEEG